MQTSSSSTGLSTVPLVGLYVLNSAEMEDAERELTVGLAIV